MKIEQIPILSDNYCYVLESGDAVAVVDPGDAGPVLRFLKERGLRVTHILNTHHHGDHINGNAAVKEAYQATLIGPLEDADRIAGLDRGVGEGETLTIGSHNARVIATPGHTRHHISFWFAEAQALFCGDTLFSLGCGRLFEGTPDQMWSSLLKLRELPPETLIYCGHEYTQSNAKFALTIDPENKKLQERVNQVDQLRRENKPTIPISLRIECETNPFLRADQSAIKRGLDLEDRADPVTVFASLRLRKNLSS